MAWNSDGASLNGRENAKASNPEEQVMGKVTMENCMVNKTAKYFGMRTQN